MASAWPMLCHDSRHTSRSPYSTTLVDGFEKWRYSSKDGVDGGIVIDKNEVLYFGDKESVIYAIYSNGTLKWIYYTDDWITSTPALAEDGTLYVGSWDTILYALNSTSGTLKWKISAHGGSIVSSPVIDDDGTIYVGTMKGTDEGELIAVNPNGTLKWFYTTGYYITSSPVIGDDRTIYIGSGDGYFYSIIPNGTLKWRFKTGDYIKAPPSIADDGTIYIGSFDDYLYALHPNNGTMKWKCKVGYGTETNPSIADDGTIYVGGEGLYAIRPNGTLKWIFNLGTDRHIHKSSPAISLDGTIYIGTNIGTSSVEGGDIIAVNPDGTEKWRKTIIDKGWVDSSPVIGEDGTVYIGSSPEAGGYIHAFGPQESNSPPEAPTISGKENGKPREEYWYKITAEDSENNPIRFYIEWGDGTSTGWTREHASREEYYYPHTWTKRGNYTIRAKAKDNSDEEGPWGYLEVNIPRTRTSSYLWYEWLLERFPLLERLLDIIKIKT